MVRSAAYRELGDQFDESEHARFGEQWFENMVADVARHERTLSIAALGRYRGDFRRLPQRFPQLKLVYAHAGIPWYRTLWEDMGHRENVFVDLSSPYLDRRLRYQALRALGASRCLYGTDGPYGYPGSDGSYDHGAILRQIERSGLSAPDLDRVLGGNFRDLAER